MRLEGVARGGYVLSDPPAGRPEVILIATGSEVALAIEAQQALAERDVATRVVSLVSWELFGAQEAAYREAVLPAAVPARLAIEAGVSFGWERWVGDRGAILGIDRFGASAPQADLRAAYGLTVDAVVAEVDRLLGRA